MPLFINRGPLRDILLTELTMTCSACPSQWDALTTDGRRLYIRYRWGTLTVSHEGEVLFQKRIGDAFDGVLSEDEMLRVTGLR